MNAPAAAPAKRSMLPMLLISAVLSIGSGAAAWFFASKGQAAAPPPTSEPVAPKVPIFYALQPVFVVNLGDIDVDRYLQVEVQILSHDQKIVDAVQLNEPMIRNRLLLLFSQQTSGDLVRRSDKERLQTEALAEVQAVLKAANAGAIDDLLFTSFVTQ